MAKVVQEVNFAECTPNILEQLYERQNKNTQDFVELKKYEYHPVFVYGTLMKGDINHRLLQNAHYLGKGITLLDCFEMRNAGNNFPVVMRHKESGKAGVTGEVYAVDPLTMLDLDQLEGNGVMYKRERVNISLREQETPALKPPYRPSLQCWMYLGVGEFWNHRNLPVIGSRKTNGAKKATVTWTPFDPTKQKVH